MVIDWSEVSAIATGIYGGATLLLVVQIWRDRVQRDRHFDAEAARRKLDELRQAECLRLSWHYRVSPLNVPSGLTDVIFTCWPFTVTTSPGL